MTSHNRSLKSSVIGVANLIGRIILASPLCIIGVLMLIMAYYFGVGTIFGVFCLLTAPWCGQHVGLLDWFGAGGVTLVLAPLCVWFTLGGAKVIKAANKIVREYPGEDRITSELASPDSLLRASSRPAADVRAELLRQLVENETPEDQMLRASQSVDSQSTLESSNTFRATLLSNDAGASTALPSTSTSEVPRLEPRSR